MVTLRHALLVCAIGGCVEAPPPAPGRVADPSALLDEAVAAGRLDGETAMVYQVLALFGDPRLPEAYRGAPSGGPHALVTACRRFATLSPPAQDALAPYLLPPAAPASWHGPAAWLTVDSDAGFRVWFQPRHARDAARATALAAATEARLADGSLAGGWLSDDGRPDNGGDGRLDVYLVRGLAVDGFAQPYPDCHATPAWVLLEGDATAAALERTLARELARAAELGLPVDEACGQY